MAEGIGGKNYEFVAREIADGYVFVNQLYLKKFTQDVLKKLLVAVNKTINNIRNEKYAAGDFVAIKSRNIRLTRLNNAAMVIKYFAKDRRWLI